MMKLPFNKWTVSLTALAGLIALSFSFWFIHLPAKVGPLPIRIGIVTWPGFAIGFVGNEKQLFSGIKPEFKIIDDTSARDASFRSGDIDLMVSSVDGFVQEYSQGIRGKIVLITDESNGGDGIVVRGDVKTPADLKGKKIAFARATPSHFLLYKVLQKAGLKTSDIEQVPVDDPGNAAQAFLGGSVDAAVTWEPFLTEVTKSGKGKILATSRDFPGTIVDVIVASPKMVEDEQSLGAFLRGWLLSIQYTQQHTAESLGIIARGLNMNAGDAEGTMAGLRLAGAPRNGFYLCEESQKRLLDIISEAATFWRDQGIISQDINPSDLVSAVACRSLQAK